MKRRTAGGGVGGEAGRVNSGGSGGARPRPRPKQNGQHHHHHRQHTPLTHPQHNKTTPTTLPQTKPTPPIPPNTNKTTPKKQTNNTNRELCGFTDRAGARLATPRLLRLKPEDVVATGGKPFRHAKFTWVRRPRSPLLSGLLLFWTAFGLLLDCCFGRGAWCIGQGWRRRQRAAGRSATPSSPGCAAFLLWTALDCCFGHAAENNSRRHTTTSRAALFYQCNKNTSNKHHQPPIQSNPSPMQYQSNAIQQTIPHQITSFNSGHRGGALGALGRRDVRPLLSRVELQAVSHGGDGGG